MVSLIAILIISSATASAEPPSGESSKETTDTAQRAAVNGSDTEKGKSSKQASQDKKGGRSSSEPEPLQLTGRVFDVDGQPAASAVARIDSASAFVPVKTEVTTHSDGRFEASVPVKEEALRSLRVRASSSDDSLLGFFRFPPDSGQAVSDALEITLERTKTATVEVVDADGKPVSNAKVAVQLAHPHTVSDAITDASGMTTLRLPESERIISVVAWKEDAGLDYRLYNLSRDQRADVNAKMPEFPAGGTETLVLSGASPLTVHVADDEQQPLDGIYVYPWLLKKESEPDQLNLNYFSGALGQRTDAAGKASFRWLPDWQASAITVWAHADGFEHTRGHYDPATDQGLLKMQLDRLVPIRGRVVNADGEPQGGIAVAARGAGYGMDGGSASTMTDDTGRYELLVPPGQIYLVVVKDAFWASAPQDGFAVLKNQPVEDVDFTLRKATRVFGTLTNEQTKEPIADERVIVYQRGQDLNSAEGAEIPNPENSRKYVQPIQFYSVTTDELGRFEFALGDGNFDIRAPRPEKVEKFAIEGEEEIEIHITTTVQEEVELKGIVIGKDGDAPLDGARVTGVARNFLGRDWQAETNAAGEFQVKRFREPTYIHVKSADGELAAIGEIEAEQDTITIETQPVGAAAGRLLTMDSEAPIAGAKIDWGVRVPSADERTWSYRFGGTAVTEDDGSFRLEELVPGREYTVSLPSRADGTIPRLTTVTAAPGEDIALGDLPEPKPRERYVPPALEDRIQAAFSVDGTPLQRHERALELVKLVNQHLLVVFGAPNDPRIHRLMKIRYEDKDFAPLRDEFRFMAIPTDDEHLESALALADALNITLADDQRAFFLVLLDAEGETIATADSETLCNEDELSKDKLFELLQSHFDDPPVAKELLDEALQQAAAEDKRVLVQETATWCGPCHLLTAFLDRHRIWEKDYVWVRMDHRFTGARELMAELRDGAAGGIPWFAILDAEGEVLVTSNDPKTSQNIGHPSEESGQVHFANMFNQTRKRLSEEDVSNLINRLADEEPDD